MLKTQRFKLFNFRCLLTVFLNVNICPASFFHTNGLSIYSYLNSSNFKHPVHYECYIGFIILISGYLSLCRHRVQSISKIVSLE